MEVKDGKYSIEAHFIRPFRTDDHTKEKLTDDSGQDLQLEAGLIIGAQLRIAIPQYNTFGGFTTMDLGEISPVEVERRRRRLKSKATYSFFTYFSVLVSLGLMYFS